MLTQDLIESISGAEAKALATCGPEGVNVVPVSVIKVSEKEIILYDFFMDKTVKNLQIDPDVALTAWSGLVGLQVKAKADYQTEGGLYQSSVEEMKVQFPDRTLRGIIVLRLTHVYDISAGASAGNLLKSPSDFGLS
ncbi:pyridoxamine 5'-phosphate oxidase family protein [Candidatus Kaiserbacteria bacterium]|nr:pyridoxamine 5'-phosphate oxidase family protein [Candidatus Kaiserbacteria bacterium]MCA9360833.1 pyridoxamine 5'-phosphate oxidase family protein [Candidatus Kaiserbacteria bacterium]